VAAEADGEAGRRLELHLAGDVGGHDGVARRGLELAVHDAVGIGRALAAEFAEGAESEIAAEDTGVELQRLPGVAVEVEVRVQSRSHDCLLLRRMSEPGNPGAEARPAPRTDATSASRQGGLALVFARSGR